MTLQPDQLLYCLHRDLLTTLSDAADTKFEGISSAARHLKREGRLPPELVSKIERIDTSYHVVRHITSQSCRAFMEEIFDELHKEPGAQRVRPKKAHSGLNKKTGCFG